MDAITGITARMHQIESRIASMAAIATTRQATATSSAASGSASFASALANAMGTTGTTGTMSLSEAAAQLNADGVPADLAKYGNGKVPESALGKVGQTGHKLWAPAATQLENLLTAAKRDGVSIGITDSYRPYDEQVDLARRKGLYSQGGLAAKPGTSQHGWGMAVDLDLDAKAQSWMRANGAKFGFVENTPREPWHWAFEPTA